VLIVGGGDLFCAREVLRYAGVTEVLNVEIDAAVTRICSWFMTDTNDICTNHPRFHLIHADAAAWVAAHYQSQRFDVFIVDSSDPTESSPAAVLYQPQFLQQLHAMLTDGGILSYQGETFWDYAPFILKFMNTLRELFPEVRHATSQIPTYPNGQIGYTIARKGPPGDHGLEIPRRPPPPGLKFYSPLMHTASFALPLFVDTLLNPAVSVPREGPTSPAV
jgi:spermidine synthase